MLNRVKIAEKEKDALEGSRGEALAYIEKQRELFSQNSVLYQFLKREAQLEHDKAQAKKEEHSKQVEYETEKFKKTEAEAKEIAAKYVLPFFSQLCLPV